MYIDAHSTFDDLQLGKFVLIILCQNKLNIFLTNKGCSVNNKSILLTLMRHVISVCI